VKERDSGVAEGACTDYFAAAMLDDRPYMREVSGSAGDRWPLTYVLMAVITACFVLQSVVLVHGGQGGWVYRYLALSLSGLGQGYVWQLLTFQFLHGGLLHLVVNLIVLYFFGRALEEHLGRRRFLRLYLGTGVVGGLMQMMFAALFPGQFGGAVVGASAGVFGLVAAFAALFPDRTLTLLVFFILPVSLRARTLLWLSIGLAVFGIVVPGDGVAHAAHLGGIIGGWTYIRWFVLGDGTSSRWGISGASSKRPRVLARTASDRQVWRRTQGTVSDDLPADEFMSREVDPILDKISAHGFQSLTERERQILEKARAKIARR
jgi:membrane associated rhomboid family serine protease